MGMVSRIYGSSAHYMREVYCQAPPRSKPKKKKRSTRKLKAHLRMLKKKRQLKEQFAAEMLLNPTSLELLLEECLRAVIKGKVALQRQAVLSGYIADFYIPDLRLVFEADGPQHTKPDAQRYDEQRDRNLARKRIETIRYGYLFLKKQPRAAIEESIRHALNTRHRAIQRGA